MANKKLTFSNLKSLSSKKFTQKKIIVDGYEVTIDEQFRPSKIKQLVLELLQKSNYMREQNIEFNLADYVVILIIKYFSDVDISDDLQKQLQAYEALIDLEYLEPILNAFDENEIKKFNESLLKYKDNMNKLLDEMVTETENDESEEIVQVDEIESIEE
jgi:hypothetical protein